MMKKFLYSLAVTVFISQGAHAQTTGTFTDSRDGQTYKTISFENALLGTSITWMAQNLNYKATDSYAYDNNESYRKALGLLYTWEAAKKACPSGWHLATDSEWSMLVSEFGGTDKAGEALKSSKGWNENGNGTNSSGLNVLPSGGRSRDGSFFDIGETGFFWSPTIVEKKDTYQPFLYTRRINVYHFTGKVSLYDKYDSECGFAVRCVRD